MRKIKEYFSNPQNIDALSDKIAINFLPLFKSGLNVQTFTVVGFSIGAQVAGYFGRKLKSKSSGSIVLPKIIGLEPGIASPENLGPSDAAFVMTIHTGNVLGELDVIGHVGFYPNGGQKQPMCRKEILFVSYDDPICSHGQVQLFWVEAITTQSATTFQSQKCNDFQEFENKTCDKNAPIGFMNTKAANTLRGKYFLKTNLQSPYSKTEKDGLEKNTKEKIVTVEFN